MIVSSRLSALPILGISVLTTVLLIRGVLESRGIEEEASWESLGGVVASRASMVYVD